MNLQSAARALGGDVSGRNCIVIPGPGHSDRDRSLSVTFDDAAPDGFLVNSFAGDDFAACRDHVRYLLGLGSYEPRRDAILTNDDKRRAVLTLLNDAEWSKWSDREIGRICKVDGKTVAKLRESVTAEIRSDERTYTTKRSYRPEQSTSKRVEFAASLWQEAKAIGSTPAETYLHGRSIDVPGNLYTGEVLRFHPACPFRLDSGETIRLPCMLSAMENAETNLFQGVHRTALQPDGSGKVEVAGLASTKKMLGPSGGAVVKLTPDEDVTNRLNIAEGIEDALTVLGNFGIAPIWATMTSGTMKAFPVLSGIETLAIFANNDLPKLHGGRLHQAGNDAARACATRWISVGREASIWLPPRIGSDFNNLVEKDAA